MDQPKNAPEVYNHRRLLMKFIAGSPLLSLGLPMCAPVTYKDEHAISDDVIIKNPEEAFSVFDFQKAAQSVLPPAHYGYLATGVLDDRTLIENEKAYSRIKLKMRRLIKVSTVLIYFLVFPKVEPTIITSKESVREVRLADGTLVWLNTNTTFSYPDKFGDERRVELEGEAFFDVARNPEHPFIIETLSSSIEVLGTSFNVNTEDLRTYVSVQSGVVELRNEVSGQKLTAGYAGIADKSGVSLFPIQDINYQSWKTGVFVFDSTPIEEVVEDLNSFYGNRIRLVSTTPCDFTTTFDNASLEDVIKILQLSCNLDVSFNEEIYYLNK